MSEELTSVSGCLQILRKHLGDECRNNCRADASGQVKHDHAALDFAQNQVQSASLGDNRLYVVQVMSHPAIYLIDIGVESKDQPAAAPVADSKSANGSSVPSLMERLT